MPMIYENWEGLVAAVLKREEIWQLCHRQSRSPSIRSESSSYFTSSFRLSDAELVFVGGSAPGSPMKCALKGDRGLGKGTFGTSILTQLSCDVRVSDQEYLDTGTELVMKKLLIGVKVTEEKFKQQMMVFGNCRHENVAAPRAYYFSNKASANFIFNDYYSQGSVSDMLHGTENPRPSWLSRLKVAVGAARGIAHIHRQCGGKLVHGNIKSSNIFLNSQQYGCVSDFGLAGVMVKPPMRSTLGYHASEHELKNASQESDVYSFGVLLLELLTGRSPTEAQGFRKNQHIVAWVRSIEPHEWTWKLFDQSLIGRIVTDEKDMLEVVAGEIPGGYLIVKDLGIDLKELRAIFRSHSQTMALEMVEIWQVAMTCLAMSRKDRPKMSDVALMLENVASSRIGKPQQACNSYNPDEKERIWNIIFRLGRS